MYQFGEKSLKQIGTCHPDLQKILFELIKIIDITVTEGHRGEAAQNKAFAEGKSKLKFPYGNHNQYPSMAVDVYPYPIDMKDTSRFYYLAGLFLGVAHQLKEAGKITHSVRWGGDWNRNNVFTDESFRDLCHFELVASK